jgi:hypothetical protein
VRRGGIECRPVQQGSLGDGRVISGGSDRRSDGRKLPEDGLGLLQRKIRGWFENRRHFLLVLLRETGVRRGERAVPGLSPGGTEPRVPLVQPVAPQRGDGEHPQPWVDQPGGVEEAVH